MREYFWTSARALAGGKYMLQVPIFEGEDDHKIPNSDAVLLRNNVHSFVGKFMAHSALHTGIVFIGLSKPIVQYIFAHSPSLDSGIEMTIKDVADIEIRQVLEKVLGAQVDRRNFLTFQLSNQFFYSSLSSGHRPSYPLRLTFRKSLGLPHRQKLISGLLLRIGCWCTITSSTTM
jgi:hypothetical protein